MIIPTETSSSGSLGQGRYVAVLPFVLAPGAELSSDEETITTSRGPFTCKLKNHINFYAVSLETFSSTDVATAYLDKLRAVMLWLSLTRKVGVSYAKGLGDVNLYNVPISNPQHGWERIDGHYNISVGEALVLPQEKNLLRVQGFAPSITVCISSVDFFKAVNEALAFAQPERVVHDDKLKLAIEIYAGHRFDSSSNSKFISLWTALESLLPDRKTLAFLQPVLKDIKVVIKEKIEHHEKDSDEWRQLDSLRSEIGKMKNETISSSIRRYLSCLIDKHPELGNPNDVFNKLMFAYNLRSQLVHNGKVSSSKDFDCCFSFLSEFMPSLLEAEYRDKANPNA